MRLFNAVIAAAVLSTHVAARPWEGPTETKTASTQVNGLSPNPTLKPFVRQQYVMAKGLNRDNTCGYGPDGVTDIYTCSASQTCLLNAASNAFECCANRAGCTFYTACLDSTRVTGGRVNSNVVSCTDSDLPYCYTLQIVSGAVTANHLDCDSVADVYTIAPSPITASSSRTRSSSSSSGRPSSSSSSSTSSSTITADSATATASPPEKKTNIGAIVGGVIGGIAGLGLIVLVAVFLCMRNSRKSAAAHQQNSFGPGQQPQQVAQSSTPQPFVPYQQQPVGSPEYGVAAPVAAAGAGGAAGAAGYYGHDQKQPEQTFQPQAQQSQQPQQQYSVSPQMNQSAHTGPASPWAPSPVGGPAADPHHSSYGQPQLRQQQPVVGGGVPSHGVYEMHG